MPRAYIRRIARVSSRQAWSTSLPCSMGYHRTPAYSSLIGNSSTSIESTIVQRRDSESAMSTAVQRRPTPRRADRLAGRDEGVREVMRRATELVGAGPAFLTVDIDVLDPAFIPVARDSRSGWDDVRGAPVGRPHRGRPAESQARSARRSRSARREAQNDCGARAGDKPAAAGGARSGHDAYFLSASTLIVRKVGSLAPCSLAPVTASVLRWATVSSEMRSPGSSWGTPGG